MELTQEQRDLLKKGEIVELTDPTVGTVVVLLPHVYEAITDCARKRGTRLSREKSGRRIPTSISTQIVVRVCDFAV